jgi:hypothetical protein
MNELFNKFDFIHEIMNENIKWLKINFILWLIQCYLKKSSI